MTKATHMMVKPLKPFEWKGDIKHPKRSKAFLVDRRKGEELKANGLVAEVPDEVPQEPAGKQSSASPAGQASPNETVKVSGDGGSEPKTEDGEKEKDPAAKDPEPNTQDGEQAKAAEPKTEAAQPTQSSRGSRGRGRGA